MATFTRDAYLGMELVVPESILVFVGIPLLVFLYFYVGYKFGIASCQRSDGTKYPLYLSESITTLFIINCLFWPFYGSIWVCCHAGTLLTKHLITVGIFENES